MLVVLVVITADNAYSTTLAGRSIVIAIGLTNTYSSKSHAGHYMLETYTVTFWLKNADTGFHEQLSEDVEASGKNSHLYVQKLIMRKYPWCCIVSIKMH